MTKKVALITGITGQDGSYLAEFLLSKNYEVHGIKRRSSSLNTQRIDHLYQDPHVDNANLFLHYGDLTDSINLINIIEKVSPDEIYNLGAQSHVAVSFETPEYTANSDALGTLRILEAIKTLNLIDNTKFYQASTSELYGLVQETPQTERTPFYPRSPYGVSKLYGHWMTVNYREAWDLHACSGILFNHESPLRGIEFVTRKITLGVAEITKKKKKSISLGNLNAKRDWGYAGDYVNAMWLMLQKEKPSDYVVATGEMYSVREFVERAFNAADTEIDWVIDNGIESGRCKKTGNILIDINKDFNRPAETDYLLGDATKAKEELNWKPQVNFNTLVEMMVKKDLDRVENGFYGF